MSTMFSQKDSRQSQRVIHDQINNSHSKQQFSFPRQERFGNTRKSYCKSSSYLLGSTLNMRSTNLGYGNKSDFTKGDNQKPGPDRYNAVSIFDKNNAKVRGSTFSLGREEIKFRKIPIYKPTPGPGRYEHDDSKFHRKQIYSMGTRTIPAYQISSTKNFPGPGSYNAQGMSKTGSYFLAKDSGSKAAVFSPATSARFDLLYKNKGIPGPGTYKFEGQNSDSRYYNSKLRSAQGGQFSLEPRTSWYSNKSLLTSPGPGYYRALSEFGDTEFPPLHGSFMKSSQSQFFVSKNNNNNNSSSNNNSRMYHQKQSSSMFQSQVAESPKVAQKVMTNKERQISTEPVEQMKPRKLSVKEKLQTEDQEQMNMKILSNNPKQEKNEQQEQEQEERVSQKEHQNETEHENQQSLSTQERKD